MAMKHLKLVFVLWCSACSSLATAMYFDQESGLSYNGNRSYRPPDGRYTQPDPIGLEGGWNRINYAYQNPLLFSDPFGLDVYPCSQPAFGIPWNPIDHHWLKTDLLEAGMGGTRGNIPGNDSGDMPGDSVKVVDHAGRSTKPGASCKKIEGVDEQKVNEALQLNRPLGHWGPPISASHSRVEPFWMQDGSLRRRHTYPILCQRLVTDMKVFNQVIVLLALVAAISGCGRSDSNYELLAHKKLQCPDGARLRYLP